MAFVDGRLDAAARADVERRLAEDPALAAEVRAYAAQRAALHARFDPVLDEPVPQRLLPGAGGARAPLARLAVAAALVAVGAAAGSLATRAVDRRGSGDGAAATLARQALVAHAAFAPDARRPVEIAAAQEQQLVAWLSKRLGRELRVPSLEARGLRLVGGRLLPGDASTPAAQLMYETGTGERVTLFLRVVGAGDGPTAFRATEEAGVTTFWWIDRDWGYALTGALPRDELLAAARAVYEQLGSGP
jgi:anti-sigma factor RsiW